MWLPYCGLDVNPHLFRREGDGTEDEWYARSQVIKSGFPVLIFAFKGPKGFGASDKFIRIQKFTNLAFPEIFSKVQFASTDIPSLKLTNARRELPLKIGQPQKEISSCDYLFSGAMSVLGEEN